jgi:hypothetical protein
MRFETVTDLNREEYAIKLFCKKYNCLYEKLDENDIDYVIYNLNKQKIGYVEVKGRNKNINEAYPLPIAVRKLHKLTEKKLQSIIIWSCLNGLLYCKLNNIIGTIKTGGRKPRENSTNDIELMAYYNKQDSIKELIFDD